MTFWIALCLYYALPWIGGIITLAVSVYVIGRTLRFVFKS
jgi:hypothetical protein